MPPTALELLMVLKSPAQLSPLFPLSPLLPLPISPRTAPPVEEISLLTAEQLYPKEE